MGKLSDKNVAVLATNGFEQSELEQPVQALKDAGATVHIVSLEAGKKLKAGKMATGEMK